MDMFAINTKVQSALEKLFQQHRLVFWYDDKAEMNTLFESLQISEVEKIVIANNEFTLKHRILIEQPTQRFLLYQPKEKPADNENWMLDLLLANYESHTEASSLYLQDLELPTEFKPLSKTYPPYCSKWNPIEHRLFSQVHRAMEGFVFTDYPTVQKITG